MNITYRRSNRTVFASVSMTFLTLTVAAAAMVATTAVLAEPMAFRESVGRPQPRVHGAGFASYLEQAVELIRDQALEVPSCRAYFQRFGVDLDIWLAPNKPPYVVSKRLTVLPWRSTSPVCGGAQGRPPFETLFVDKGCFRGRDVCDLASLLMHEMGHLARRDTRDNEPLDFFAACRLSACVDPARYH